MSVLVDRLGPRESAAYIIANASGDIKLSEEGVLKATKLALDAASSGEFTEYTYFSAIDVHPKTADRKAVDWIFLVDTINFSFWSDEKSNFKVTFHGKEYTGYFAACACINRALEENVPITNADYMEHITIQDVRKIFKTDDGSEIPLLHERLEVISEAGRILNQKFGGTFYNCILKCEKSGVKLLKDIVENFESYRDFAIYKGQKVSFLKRAQILVNDIYLRLQKDDDACNFRDICELTMFADYRVPQALCFLGVLQYSPKLMEILKEKKLLPNGSEYEVEIRGFSIKACDEIVKAVQDKGPKNICTKLTAADVDNFLWLFRRKNAAQIEKTVPFHRTRCIYY